MKYTLKAYSIWEQGPRKKQEDSLYPKFGEANDNDRLFIVCDGMGGHSAGEVASGTVCAALSKSVLSRCQEPEGEFSDDIFRAALNDAYDELDKQDNGAEKKMGTTLTFLKLHENGATIAHIGDSRVYHIRPGKSPEETEILFQTTDHSLVNDLIKIGELTPEEAKYSNQKNVITRAMQPNMERRHHADIYHTSDIKSGDYFMLCSDGILEQLEDDNIRFIFSDKAGDAENKTRMLVQVTEHNHDNHTAVLVHITDVIMTDDDAIKEEPKYLEAQINDDDDDDDGITGSKYHITDNTIDDDNDDVDDHDITKNENHDFKYKPIVMIVICFLVAFFGFRIYKKNSNKKKAEQKIEIERQKEEQKIVADRKRRETELINEQKRLEKEKEELQAQKEEQERIRKEEEAKLKAEQERLEQERIDLENAQQTLTQTQIDDTVRPDTPQKPSVSVVNINDLNKINGAVQNKKDDVVQDDVVDSDAQKTKETINNQNK